MDEDEQDEAAEDDYANNFGGFGGAGGDEGGLSNIDFSKLGGMGGAGGMPDLSALAGAAGGAGAGEGEDEGDDEVSDQLPLFDSCNRRTKSCNSELPLLTNVNRRNSLSLRRPTKRVPRSRRSLNCLNYNSSPPSLSLSLLLSPSFYLSTEVMTTRNEKYGCFFEAPVGRCAGDFGLL